jgi:hypothetical protein
MLQGLLKDCLSHVNFSAGNMNMVNGERSGPGGRDDWRIRLTIGLGAAACMAGAMIFGPVVGINGFWPGLLAILVAIVIGIVVGRLVGGMLFQPPAGDPPDNKTRKS